MTQRSVHLIVPGLLGPLSGGADKLPPTPALDRLIARGERLPVPERGVYQALFETFGVNQSMGDLPIGAYGLLGDGGDPDLDATWFRADPVHLRADRDNLILFDGSSLDIMREEADALCAAFNRQFEGDGLRLIAPTPERWYLRVGRHLRASTTPVELVRGGSVDGMLPAGPDGALLNSWLNEAQMLFHAEAVNRARESQGMPLINGIWAWGGARFGAEVVDARCNVLLADDPTAFGLAQAAGIDCHGLKALARPDKLADGLVVVIWDRLALLLEEPKAWCDGLMEVDNMVEWLSAEVKSGTLTSLRVDSCLSAGFDIDRKSLGRFWKRKPGFGDVFRAGN